MGTSAGRALVVHCHPSGTIEPGTPDATPALRTGAIHLWYAPLDRLRPRSEALRELLDPVELDRMARFRFEHDRERFVIGHGLMRELLGRYLQRDGSLVRIARGPFGKPYLERKTLRFNMSDTKDAILIGFTLGMEIGVDIETTARSVDHEAVGRHYFTPAEIRSISEAGDRSRERFLEFWTRKEAVLKASGVGIMEDLRALRVDAPRNELTINHDAFCSMAAPEYHVRTWSVGDRHVLSLAVPTDVKDILIRHAAHP